VSDYTEYLERLLAEDLGAEEWRLAAALVRCLLGHRKRSEYLGRELLRDTSGLHGRSLERARAGLVERGLLRYEPATPGRGHRSRYELLIEKAAPERHFTAPEKAAPERHLTEQAPAAQNAAQNAALERPRIEKGSTYRLKDLTTADEEKLETVLGPVTTATLSKPERTWDGIAGYVLEHGGTSWGPVQAAVPGEAGYLARRRDYMLEAGVLVNHARASFDESRSAGFELWHRDDPRRPQT
jgi:hypothetical protein